MNPAVTVVIPTKDRWSFLPIALGVALAQRDVDFEVVVIDDGSSDDTARGLAQIEDNRVRVVRHDATRGLAATRNHGIELARGDWIAFLDDDDLWSPDKLRLQLAGMRTSRAVFSYTGIVVLDEHLRVVEQPPVVAPEALRRELRKWNVAGGPSTMMARTDVLRGLGGFDARMTMMEDWDMWLRLTAVGSGALCPDVLTGYVVHSANMCSVDVDHIEPQFQYLAKKHWPGRDPRQAGMDGVRMSRWIASVHRANGDRRAAVGAYLAGARAYHSAGNLVRAAGTLLGETAMARVRARPVAPDEPDWVATFRRPAIEVRGRGVRSVIGAADDDPAGPPRSAS